jgi:hypothetical protein
LAFTPTISAPTNLASATTAITSPTRSISYVVSSVDENGQESLPTAAETVVVESPWLAGQYVTLTWTAATNAAAYNVYKNDSGYYGWIGTATDTSFVDDYVRPDTSYGPKSERTIFNSANNYPSTVSIYQQRLIYANTNNEPQTVFTSATNALTTFSLSEPLSDEDPITVELYSGKYEHVNHLISQNDLVILTGASTWTMAEGQNSDVLTPYNASFRLRNNTGSNQSRPVVAGDTVLYSTRDGKHLIDMAYTITKEEYVGIGSYNGSDLTVLVPHLFKDSTIKEMAFQESPDRLIWVVMADGSMRTMTFLKEQSVWAWARHDTDGIYLSVCSIPSLNGEDTVYFITQRTVDGSTVYYIEEMQSRYFTDKEDCFFVDCGISFSGSGLTTVSGLDHLEGETVSIFADGSVLPQQVVTSGEVTLSVASDKCCVGLPITSELWTLPLNTDIPLMGRRKMVPAIVLRLDEHQGGFVGQSDVDANLTELWTRTDEDYNEATNLFTGDKRQTILGTWDYTGEFYYKQTDPLPMGILSIMFEFNSE